MMRPIHWMTFIFLAALAFFQVACGSKAPASPSPAIPTPTPTPFQYGYAFDVQGSGSANIQVEVTSPPSVSVVSHGYGFSAQLPYPRALITGWDEYGIGEQMSVTVVGSGGITIDMYGYGNLLTSCTGTNTVSCAVTIQSPTPTPTP